MLAAARAPAAGALLLALMLPGACDASRPPRARPHEAARRRVPATPHPPRRRIERACSRRIAYPRPDPRRIHYALDVRVPARGPVVGHLSARFLPDRPTDRLVFRLWPNGPRQARAGAHLATSRLTIGNRRAAARLTDPTTLVADLGAPVAAGTEVKVGMDWSLETPGPVLDRISRRGKAVRLGSFFPLLAWRPGAGWVTDPPTATLAEASTSPTADFDARIVAPAGTSVIATGTEVAPGHWRAVAVRDFAVAVGNFTRAAERLRAPRPVDVTVGVERGVDGEPQVWLDKVTRALTDLSKRFGPYPWSSFSVAVMPDLAGAGIEYPTMVFQGEDSLRRATTHEVGHSWFYSLVGNDQAAHPWLDEGLTSWAQARGDRLLWWFGGLRLPPGARGRLGAPMTFWDHHSDDYYLGVYAQTVKALSALGPARLVDCALRRYVADNAYGIAEPGDLVRALSGVFPRARAVLRRFGAVGASSERRL
jgi:hypothetical protein